MLPLDVDGLVDDFTLEDQLGPLVVERRAAPTRNAFGEMVQASPTLLRLRPWTAHTATGRTLLQVPEADRNSEVTQFYTGNVRLYVADAGREPDVIRYNDRRWRVVRVDNYAAQGRAFWALAVLIEQSGDA